MTEPIIDRPVTRTEISDGLYQLGLRPGMTLIVHSSLKSFGGWIPGGAPSVVLALQDVLGPEGTLVMPTQSMDLTDPSTWMNPPADPKWWELIRAEMPAYDPEMTETSGMGAIVDAFRQSGASLRSLHPHVSFAARGRLAPYIIEKQAYDYPLGEESPLARLYDADAHVLLIGCGHDRNTSLHLAEYRTEYKGRKEIQQQAPVLVQGSKQWITYRDYNISSDDFDKLGQDYELTNSSIFARGHIRQASCFLAPQRALVDYAAEWLRTKREL